MTTLLPWQQDCLARYETTYDYQNVFTLVAGTGSGKTHAGCSMLAYAIMRETGIDCVFVVGLTNRAIRRGWAKTLKKYGITDFTENNNYVGDDGIKGVLCTYASMGDVIRVLIAKGMKIILILDEFHHLEQNNKWAQPIQGQTIGDGNDIIRAILMSGTPWHEKGELLSIANYENDKVTHDKYYDYGMAVNDEDQYRNVVPVQIKAIHGIAHQSIYDPDTGEKKQGTRVLDSETMPIDAPLTPFVDFDAETIHTFDVVRDLVCKAVRKLDQLRMGEGTEYVGGMFITKGAQQARVLKRYLLEVYGKNSVVVSSDDPKAQDAIAKFDKDHSQEWLISIDMVSEGVDIPRLKVLGDLTNKLTLMSIIQRWGRVLRRVRKPDNTFAINSSAYIYHIGHKKLIKAAEELEKEVLLARKEPGEGGPPPEVKNIHKTDRQDSTGEDTIIHGRHEETETVHLAQWLWDTNYHDIRNGVRGHTDCMWYAKELLQKEMIPDSYVRPEERKPDELVRSYDELKRAAIDNLTAEVSILANEVFDGDYGRANAYLNSKMGISSYSSSKSDKAIIEYRTELARMRTARGAA